MNRHFFTFVGFWWKNALKILPNRILNESTRLGLEPRENCMSGNILVNLCHFFCTTHMRVSALLNNPNCFGPFSWVGASDRLDIAYFDKTKWSYWFAKVITRVIPVYIHFYFKNTYFHINFYIVTFIAFYCSVSEVFIVYRRTEFSSIIFILLDLMMGSILMSPLAGPVDSLTSHHGIFALISAQILE